MKTLASLLVLAMMGDGQPPAPPKSGEGEVVRVITIGAQTIPLAGFEPGPAGGPQSLGTGTLTAVASMPPMPRVSKPDSSPNGGFEEIWHLTLPDAIRIGLENSEVVRVLPADAKPSPGGNRPRYVISRLNADASAWNFQSAIMAQVRSVEQQYWALAYQQVAVWSRETAVKIGEEILARERADLEHGRATAVTVAEAEQRVETFKLNLITAVSDVITAERQLRNILGLPALDARRIVPATEPTEARVEPVWEDCLIQMRASQPDIVQQEALVRLAEIRLASAQDPSLPTADPAVLEPRLGMPVGLRAAAPTFDADRVEKDLARQRAFLQQVLHQTTHSLARFTLEVDANYRQFEAARRLSAAGQKRLESQRSLHEEGGLTIDRLLDAVAQYAGGVEQEALYKSSYNTSLVALEEAKGTLLAHDGIAVIDPPPSRPAPRPADDRVAPAAFSADAPAPAPPTVDAILFAPATYKLTARLGGKPILEVEVKVNPVPPAKAAP